MSRTASPTRYARYARALVFLCLMALLMMVIGCGPRDREAGQSLAAAGGKTAETMAAYYDSLAVDADRQPDLEIFYRHVNSLPDFGSGDQQILARQAASLRHRAAMCRSLEAIYAALGKLSSYDSSKEVKQSVDGLTGSLKQITSEPPQLFGTSASSVVTPIINGLVTWRQSSDIDKAAATVRPTLDGIRILLAGETPAYLLITRRHYVLIGGDHPPAPTHATTGVAEHLLQSQSMNLQFFLTDVPEVQGLPWSDAPVQDTMTKDAMQRVLNAQLSRLETKSEATPSQLGDALQALATQHDKFAQKQQLTLETVLSYQEQAQTYIDLLTKLRGVSPKQ